MLKLFSILVQVKTPLKWLSLSLSLSLPLSLSLSSQALKEVAGRCGLISIQKWDRSSEKVGVSDGQSVSPSPNLSRGQLVEQFGGKKFAFAFTVGTIAV